MSVMRLRARPLGAVCALALFFASIVIMPAAYGCTPPDEPFNIELLGGSAAVTNGVDLDVEGAYLYVATPDGLTVFDVTDPAAPTAVGSGYATSSPAVRLLVSGSRAYVATDAGRVVILDVTDPLAPALLGQYDSGKYPHALAASANRLYVGASDGLHVVDVSDPTAPVRVGYFATPQPVTDVVLDGSVAYAAYSYYTVAVATGVYETYPTTVIALNVASDWPTLLASHQIPAGRVRLALGGGYLYVAVAGSGGYLKVFDVVPSGSLDYRVYIGVGSYGALDVAADGTDVYLAGKDDTRAYDLAYTDAPYLSALHPDGAKAIDAADDVVFTLDTMGTVRVYQYLPTSERSLGADRYKTAVDLSKQFAAAEYVVLATGANYPDALAGAPLAYLLDCPILLVDRDAIPSSVKAEIKRLGATKAYILGGTGVVSDRVVAELRGLGMAAGNIKRLAGTNRYDTSAKVALEMKARSGSIANAFIATGENFPDALAGSGAAAKMGAPILLVERTSVPGATRQALSALGVKDTYVLGGTAVVSDAVMRSLPSPLRLAGSDRFGTARAVADWAIDRSGAGFAETTVFVVTGRNFPDAMPCGVRAAIDNAATVLVNEDVPGSTRSFLMTRAAGIDNVRVVGGTSAVSSEVERVVVSLVK
ncbi:MAG: cell wall-binding repeat-containing protein [Anaerosomatales bacterium]|nr:cell wall-binding repeat-containing protein [Anaerosomatales bacterium]